MGPCENYELRITNYEFPLSIIYQPSFIKKLVANGKRSAKLEEISHFCKKKIPEILYADEIT